MGQKSGKTGGKNYVTPHFKALSMLIITGKVLAETWFDVCRKLLDKGSAMRHKSVTYCAILALYRPTLELNEEMAFETKIDSMRNKDLTRLRNTRGISRQ